MLKSARASRAHRALGPDGAIPWALVETSLDPGGAFHWALVGRLP